MKKLFTHLFLTLCLMFALCACGKNGTNTGATSWQEQYDLGVRYLSELKYEEAIVAFTSAIEIEPNKPEAYLGRADAYIASGETEEHLNAALADFEFLLSLDETMVDAWMGVADVYIRKGEFDKALDLLKEALSKTNQDSSILDKMSEIENGNITDSSGRLRRESSYDANGVLEYYLTYTYHADGREASVTLYDPTGYSSHIDIQYNEDGYQLNSYFITSLDHHYALGKYEWEYGEDNRETKCTAYLPNGDIRDYQLSQYDNQGNLIRTDKYNADNILSYHTLYEYDSNGYCIKQSNYDASNNLVLYVTFERDAHGNLIRHSNYEENGTLMSYTMYYYNDDGEQIRVEYYDGEGNPDGYSSYE